MVKNINKTKFVKDALTTYGTCNAKQLSCFIKRKYNEDISPSVISGVLRTLVAKGAAGKSNCGAGSTMYWVNTAITNM